MENSASAIQLNRQTQDSSLQFTRTYNPPRKYDKLIHKTTQIPRVSILRFIAQADQDNDGWITADDIVKFSQKHYLFFEQELARDMIQEALSKRIVAFPEQRKEPINVDEILSAVHLHYVLSAEHVWVEKQRPYRDKWVQLLQAAGESLPNGHDLEPIKVEKIKAMHELDPFAFKPRLNASQSQQIVKVPLKQKPEFTKDKPEAGLIIQESDNIRPMVTEIKKSVDKDSPFEKVVNQKIHKPNEFELGSSIYPTITFESQLYYQEADRLSRMPSECKDGRHPIYKFMPENRPVADKSPTMSRRDLDEAKSQSRDLLSLNLQMTKKATKYQSQPVLSRLPYHGIADKATLNSRRLFNNSKKQLINQYGEEERQKPIFLATFQPENVHTLKHKLARLKQKELEQQQDFYLPPSQHKFRDEYVDSSKPLYKTRIKPDPLPNPHLMSEHDQRPQFAIEQEMKVKLKDEQEKQKLIDDYMGTFKQTKPWVKYFPTADLNHNFVDQKRPNFLDKGPYQEPGMILLQFLREGAAVEDNFQLFHRALRTTDKHMYLGLQMEPN